MFDMNEALQAEQTEQLPSQEQLVAHLTTVAQADLDAHGVEPKTVANGDQVRTLDVHPKPDFNQQRAVLTEATSSDGAKSYTYQHPGNWDFAGDRNIIPLVATDSWAEGGSEITRAFNTGDKQKIALYNMLLPAGASTLLSMEKHLRTPRRTPLRVVRRALGKLAAH